MSNPITRDIHLLPEIIARFSTVLANAGCAGWAWVGHAERWFDGRVRTATRAVAVSMLLALIAGSTVARSADMDLLGGASATSHGRLTPAVAVDWLGNPWQWKNMAVQPDIGLTYVAGRRDQSDGLHRSALVVAAGVRFPELWHQLFFSFQVGVAAPHTPALSSTHQFVSSLGWSDHNFVIIMRHISDASTRAPNLGETMLLAGVRLQIE